MQITREIMICKRELFTVIMQKEAWVAAPSSCPGTFSTRGASRSSISMSPEPGTVSSFEETTWSLFSLEMKIFQRGKIEPYCMILEERLAGKGILEWEQKHGSCQGAVGRLFLSPGTSSLAASHLWVRHCLFKNNQLFKSWSKSTDRSRRREEQGHSSQCDGVQLGDDWASILRMQLVMWGCGECRYGCPGHCCSHSSGTVLGSVTPRLAGWGTELHLYLSPA